MELVYKYINHHITWHYSFLLKKLQNFKIQNQKNLSLNGFQQLCNATSSTVILGIFHRWLFVKNTVFQKLDVLLSSGGHHWSSDGRSELSNESTTRLPSLLSSPEEETDPISETMCF
jgi:hypothetical protein